MGEAKTPPNISRSAGTFHPCVTGSDDPNRTQSTVTVSGLEECLVGNQMPAAADAAFLRFKSKIVKNNTEFIRVVRKWVLRGLGATLLLFFLILIYCLYQNQALFLPVVCILILSFTIRDIRTDPDFLIGVEDNPGPAYATQRLKRRYVSYARFRLDRKWVRSCQNFLVGVEPNPGPRKGKGKGGNPSQKQAALVGSLAMALAQAQHVNNRVASSPNQSSSLSNPKTCKFALTPAGCKKGSSCTYYHPPGGPPSNGTPNSGAPPSGGGGSPPANSAPPGPPPPPSLEDLQSAEELLNFKALRFQSKVDDIIVSNRIVEHGNLSKMIYFPKRHGVDCCTELKVYPCAPNQSFPIQSFLLGNPVKEDWHHFIPQLDYFGGKSFKSGYILPMFDLEDPFERIEKVEYRLIPFNKFYLVADQRQRTDRDEVFDNQWVVDTIPIFVVYLLPKDGVSRYCLFTGLLNVPERGYFDFTPLTNPRDYNLKNHPLVKRWGLSDPDKTLFPGYTLGVRCLGVGMLRELLNRRIVHAPGGAAQSVERAIRVLETNGTFTDTLTKIMTEGISVSRATFNVAVAMATKDPFSPISDF